MKTVFERRDDKEILQESYVETYGDRIIPDTSLEVEVDMPGTLHEKYGLRLWNLIKLQN